METEFIAEELIKSIQENRLDPRSISETTRRLLVQHLSEFESKTYKEISELLKIGHSTVWRDLEKVEETALELIAPFQTEKVAKKLYRKAAILSARARDKGNIELEWKIECDLVANLGRMGFIYYKGDPINIHIGDKKETNVTAIAIGAGSEELLGAINREIEQIDELKKFLIEPSNEG